MIEAIKAQYDRLSFGYTADFTSDPIDALADTIVDQAGGGLSRVSFVSGGSEATETAIKIALQYTSPAAMPGGPISSPAASPGMATRWERCRSPATRPAAAPMSAR